MHRVDLSSPLTNYNDEAIAGQHAHGPQETRQHVRVGHVAVAAAGAAIRRQRARWRVGQRDGRRAGCICTAKFINDAERNFMPACTVARSTACRLHVRSKTEQEVAQQILVTMQKAVAAGAAVGYAIHGPQHWVQLWCCRHRALERKSQNGALLRPGLRTLPQIVVDTAFWPPYGQLTL